MCKKMLNQYIDHTLLDPCATASDIEKLCREAVENEFYSVCVNSCRVAEAKRIIENIVGKYKPKITCVCSFPLGASHTRVKAFEAELAFQKGADEVDMVINLGMLKSGDYDFVEKDIGAVVDVSRKYRGIVKVIIETCYLNELEKKKACETAVKAGADFVKTSTGFGSCGAKAEDVRLMRNTVGEGIGVKASGSVRSREKALKLIEAGADRIGASKSTEIVD